MVTEMNKEFLLSQQMETNIKSVIYRAVIDIQAIW
jgi:hypothetical protein